MNDRITQIMLGVLILLALIGVAMLQTGHREALQVQQAILDRLEALEAAPAPLAANPAPPDEYADARPAAPGDEPTPTPAPAPLDNPPADETPGETPDERPPLDIVGIRTPAPPPPAPGPAEPRNPAPPSTAGGDDALWQQFGPTIERVMTDLLAGRYDAVADRFNPEMASALDATRLAAAMNPVRQRAGAFERVTYYESLGIPMPSPDMHPFRVIVDTEKDVKLTFTITVTDAKQIAGLYIN
jgi:hypothetical protein